MGQAGILGNHQQETLLFYHYIFSTTTSLALPKTLIDNPKLRQTMGIKAKASVAGYSWEQATTNLLKIWQQQIKAKSN